MNEEEQMKNLHVMIDLETMGTRPSSPVISIGAVAFSADGLSEHVFYDIIDLTESVRGGATIDAETVIWWLGQSEESRSAITRRGTKLDVVLDRFDQWLAPLQVAGVWGNGASFDNTILTETYVRSGRKAPWPFWKDRCYRTIKSLFPEVPMVRRGTHHNALDDARTQAEHLIAINAKHGPFL